MVKPLNVQLAQMAQKGAKLGSCGRMCNTCAFKLNSPANLESDTVEAAFDALAWGMQFNCHPQDTGFGDGGKLCVGYQYALQHLNDKN